MLGGGASDNVAMLAPAAEARPGTVATQSRVDPGGHPAPADCEHRGQLVALFAERGIEMTVSSTAPLFSSPYRQLGMRCPHGTLWHTEPTREQVLRWEADGTP